MRSGLMIGASCALAIASAHALGAEVTPESEINRFLKARQTISDMGPTPFGEQVNLYTGELSFQQTDIRLPGIGPDIAIIRTTRTSQDSSVGSRADGTISTAFGTWDLNIPRIETLVRTPNYNTLGTVGENWKIAYDGPDTYKRCSHSIAPYMAQDDWWRGVDLFTPDGSQQTLLSRAPENPRAPGSQPSAYPYLTPSNWQISCLPNTSNGEPGEAFLAISPDGTKYYFQYLSGIRANSLKLYETDPDGRPRVMDRVGRMLARTYVTQVVDRFGNSVTYEYQGDHLTHIRGSDGRHVEIVWRTDWPLIDSIRVQPESSSMRTWQYQYELDSGGSTTSLSTVIQPDGSAWRFAGIFSVAGAPTDDQQSRCLVRSGLANQGTFTASVITPSGLTGTFISEGIWHSRSYVPSECWGDQSTPIHETEPPLFGAFSLRNRTISGPGVPTQTWTYDYSAPQGSTTYDPCAANNTCPDTAFVDVTAPSGDVTRHTFSNRWGPAEGKVTRVDWYQGNTQILKTEQTKYASPTLGPYPVRIGHLLLTGHTNPDKVEQLTPVREVSITQQGRIFTSFINTFNEAGLPISITRSSIPAP